MAVVTRQRLPEGLAQMPPGPGLCAVLATVDRTRLTSEDLCVFTAARYRLLAHVNAEFLADLYETGQAAHEPEGSLTRAAELKDRAGEQIAWELCVSSSYADGQLELGRQLARRLPNVGQALRDGRIDYGKAHAFVDALCDVDDDDVARAIADLLLGRAARWTVAQLRDKLRYHIARAEPDKRREKYLRRVADRRVWLQPFTDGTAFLAGSNLPPHLARRAYNYLDRLARAAKALGDPRTLPQLRADAYLALLAGEPFRYQPPVDPLSQEADAQAAADGTIVDDPDDLAGRTPPPAPRHRPPRYRRHLRRVDPDESPADPDPADPDAADAAAADDPTAAGAAPPRAGPVRPGPRRLRRPVRHPSPPPVQPPSQARLRRPSRVNRIRDRRRHRHRRPRRAGRRGTGPRNAGPTPNPRTYHPTTRTRTSTPPDPDPQPDRDHTPIQTRNQTGNQPDRPNQTGSTGHSGQPPQPPPTLYSPPVRPADICSCGRVKPADRRGELDIVAKLTTLIGLDDDPAMMSGWGPVLADIARRAALEEQTNPHWKWSMTDENGLLLHYGHTQRRPTPTEAAFVRARDRVCKTKGCRQPSTKCDLDHRHERAKGGPTHRGNLDP